MVGTEEDQAAENKEADKKEKNKIMIWTFGEFVEEFF